MADNKGKALNDNVVVYKDVEIAMSDGTTQVAAVMFPAENGKVDFSVKRPVVLTRTSYMALYGLAYSQNQHYYMVQKGYIFVYNATRGTYLSEGDDTPAVHEAKDSIDVINWIYRQPWCDGRIFTMGKSYLGMTSYLAHLESAKEKIPGLNAGAVDCPAMNGFKNSWPYYQDFFDYGTLPTWPLMQAAGGITNRNIPDDVIEKIVEENKENGDLIANSFFVDPHALAKKFGLKNIPVVRHIPYYQNWLDHRDNLEFFDYTNIYALENDMKEPMLFIGGWYDLFGMNAIEGYEKAVKETSDAEIAKSHRLIMHPFEHVMNPATRIWPEADCEIRAMIEEWFEQFRTGVPSEYYKDRPVTLFVMGENRWRAEQEWPLKDTENVKYYIHSAGAANTLMGNGTLSKNLPAADEPQDHYMADPSDPVYCFGGRGLRQGGVVDQRTVEMRRDVLIYTSDVLEEDLEVTGCPKARLYASTSATDTDFFMYLEDVAPDGTSNNVVSGGRRGRYLKGRMNPQPLVPGKVEVFEISFDATSMVFKKGHKLRIRITSSDAHNCDVNPNAFVDLNTCTEKDYVIAAQTIYHNSEYSSYVELPVIPENHKREWLDDFTFDLKLEDGSVYSRTLFLPETVIDGKELPVEKNS